MSLVELITKPSFFTQCKICKIHSSPALNPISLKPFPHLALSICHLSLLTTPTLQFPALLCFPHSLPSFAILFNFMLFSKHFSSFNPFPTTYISTCPRKRHSHPCTHHISPTQSLFLLLSPPPCLPAVLKLYLRHSAPSILSSKWDVWPCYI